MRAAPSRDWNVCTPIVADPWEPLPRAQPRDQTASDAGLVAQRREGGNPETRGSLAYRCWPCGPGTPLVALRGTSSLG